MRDDDIGRAAMKALHPAARRVLLMGGLVVLIGLPLALLYLVYGFDWNRGRDALSRAASAQAQRKIVIHGDVRPSWAWPVSRLAVSDIVVDNLDGGSAPHMLTIEQLEVAVDLRKLLTGKLELPDLVLLKPNLLLEKTPQGVVNWDFSDRPLHDPARAVPVPAGELLSHVAHLTVQEGHITYKDPRQHTAIRMQVRTVHVKAADTAQGLHFEGAGVAHGEAVKFQLSGGGVRELSDAASAYPLSASLVIGDTSIVMHGTVTDAAMLKGLSLTVTIKGSNAADLFPLTGIALPPTPPYEVAGQLDFSAGVWRFSRFAGRLGDSDLAGDLRWDVRGTRPMLNANFTSRKLDLDDLAGLIGARPGTGPGETASVEQVAAAADATRDARLLPDMPLDLSRMAAMDALVELRGIEVVTSRLPFRDFYLKAALADSVLQITPVRFGTGSGNFVVWATLNAKQQPVQVFSRTELQRIPIASAFDNSAATLGTPNLAQGYLGGTAELTGSGQSLRQMLADSNGSFGIGMQGGQLSQVLVEIIGLDIAESVGYLLAGDQPVPIHCVIADFKVSHGVLTPRAFVIDTDDTVVTGTGTINLQDESLNLELKPVPKDFSPLSLRVPLEIGGTLKKPQFRVKRNSLLARGAAAAALAVLFPPAAILALIELGPGEDSQCRPLLAAMAGNSRDPANNARLVPNNPTTTTKKNVPANIAPLID